MFLDFFLLLKAQGLPVSIGEYLNVLEALKQRTVQWSVQDFYYLSRTILIKHEQYLDRFDLLFGQYFQGISILEEMPAGEVPEDWLKKELDRLFTEEEKALIEKMGGLDALLKRLQELLEEQKEKHAGGNKWIGTGGVSPFGHSGYNPEGIRVGGKSGHRTAVKVWDKRSFKDYASDVELNTRNIKMALRRLRVLTREGLEEELNLDATIQQTSKNAGYLDIQLQASKKNRIKVLLFLDVGGSMDDHVEVCAQLFSAAKTEFKHLEYFYFHNCLYESVWKDNHLRWDEKIPTMDILHKFNSDYRVIFVGDATMSPYELTHVGGSVEHYNDESGITWMRRVLDKFPYAVWINPSNEHYWQSIHSLQIVQQVLADRMYPMTMEGLTNAIKTLKRKTK